MKKIILTLLFASTLLFSTQRDLQVANSIVSKAKTQVRQCKAQGNTDCSWAIRIAKSSCYNKGMSPTATSLCVDLVNTISY